jgi:hypothetical protein
MRIYLSGFLGSLGKSRDSSKSAQMSAIGYRREQYWIRRCDARSRRAHRPTQSKYVSYLGKLAFVVRPVSWSLEVPIINFRNPDVTRSIGSMILIEHKPLELTIHLPKGSSEEVTTSRTFYDPSDLYDWCAPSGA